MVERFKKLGFFYTEGSLMLLQSLYHQDKVDLGLERLSFQSYLLLVPDRKVIEDLKLGDCDLEQEN